MPLNGSDVASRVSGAAAVANTVAESAKYNSEIADIYEILNTVRTIATGHTGASTAVGAHDNIVTKGTTVASASTLNLDTATGALVDVSGTTTVTAVTLGTGKTRTVRATGAFQITAGSSLIVDGSTTVSYTCAPGDLLFFEGYGSSVVRVWKIGSAVRDGLEVISVATASSSSSLSFTLDTARYSNFMLVFDQILPASDAVDMRLRASDNGGSSYDNGTNYTNLRISNRIGSTSPGGSGATGDIAWLPIIDIDNGATGGVSGTVQIYSMVTRARIVADLTAYQSAGNFMQMRSAGHWATAGMNAVQILMSSGNIASGSITLYGRRKT